MTLRFYSCDTADRKQIVDLFSQAFANSEGQKEGKIIDELVYNLLADFGAENLYTFCAYEDAELVGSVIFSRMQYSDDNRSVFLLSPLAVKTSCQGQGIGQKLISFGLHELRTDGVDVVLTYGNPDYYQKTGFKPAAEEIAKPPHKLTHPYGWQIQFLQEDQTDALKGDAKCVCAFDSPDYW